MKKLALLLCVFAVHAAFAAELKPFGRGSWKDIRTHYANQPLVVHLWGITCAPCLAELPHWKDLADEQRGMNLVLIAADPGPVDAAKVQSTLAKAKLAGGENWIFADSFTDRLRFEVDTAWRGELPRTLLIEAGGGVTVLSGVADLDVVRKWLRAQGTK